MYTIVYTYEKNPSIFRYMYVPREDYMLIMEGHANQDEPAEIAEVISHKFDPVKKEDNSLWIKNWRVG